MHTQRFRIFPAPLDLAAELARVLHHGCAPYSRGHQTVAALHAAMAEAAARDNAAAPPDFRWAAPWEWGDDDDSLVHRSATGRVGVWVSTDRIEVGLYSPAWAAGEEPFLLVAAGEEEISVTAPAGAEAVVTAKPSRLDAVVDFLVPVFGVQEMYDSAAAEPWIKTAFAAAVERRYGEDGRGEEAEIIVSQWLRHGV